jgi:ferredoxin
MDRGNLPALTQEQRTVPAFAHRCKQLRHRQSECRICVEICPEGAITLDPGPAVSERCTRCGLCQTACPTEVFQGEVHTDQRLLDRIGSMSRPERRVGATPEISVHCREAEAPCRDSVVVPCLGALTGNFLLGAAASGANPVTLVHGDCHRCRLRSGEQLFAKAMATYLALAHAIGLERSAIRVEQRQRSDRALAARRRFLARVTGLGTQGAGDWPAPGIETAEPSRPSAASSAGPTPGRAHLQTLLRGASWTSTPSISHDARLPWASVRIDQSDCATCGTCVNLCPTGAITRRIENDRLSHRFNSALCINCRLCEEACPQQVISFDPDFDARDLVRDEARAITDIRLHACESCGETLPEREGRFCLTCQRRGKVDSYIPRTLAMR